MHITCGLHLDPGLWPHPLYTQQAIAGHTAVGPLGLLETHLGLTAPAISPSLRIAAFTQTLQHHDTDTRFYHRSFARDSWGVSAHLLTWHDQLIASGWDATPIGPPHTRLHDFTTLEPPPHPSAGQRLWTAY